MRKIAVSLQKGGVGKTTISGNLGYAIALGGEKTLLIDGDPQGNLSSWYLKSTPDFELADVMRKTAEIEKAFVKIAENLFIIPTFGLSNGLKDFAESELFKQPFAFQKLITDISKLDFKFVIFDLSPGMSQLERSIISAVDEIITPFSPEFFGMDGLEIFNKHLKEINENYQKNVIHKKIVVNGFNRSFKEHLLFYSQLSSLDYKIYTIGQDRKLATCQGINKSIFSFPSSKNIPEFNRLAADLIGG
jgi:cellulose biosynthesis protein BcsQ